MVYRFLGKVLISEVFRISDRIGSFVRGVRQRLGTKRKGSSEQVSKLASIRAEVERR